MESLEFRFGFNKGFDEGLSAGSSALLATEPEALAQYIYHNLTDERFAKFADAVARLKEI